MSANPRLPFLAEAGGTAGAAENGFLSIRRRELEASQSALFGLRALAEDLRCVLVTSTGAGDALGVAIGLATAAALEGRRVMLIECDLGRPGLARRLGLRPTPGLAEYLSWEASAPQILRPLDLSGAGVGAGSAVGQLVCVAAGSATGDAAGLIATDSFDGAMRNVRSAYELVLLFCRSPDEPEIQALLRHADAVGLCATAADLGGSGAEKLDAAQARLSQRPAGLVLVPD
jgi:Mrp family chromosome partitioning ATPase